MKPLTKMSEQIPSLYLTGNEAEIAIHPENEGIMAAVTKAPELRVSKVEVGLTPFPFGYGTPIRIDVSISTDALVVVSDNLSSSDRARIELLIREKMLGASGYSKITFHGTASFQEAGESTVAIVGKLKVRDIEKSLAFDAKKAIEGVWSADFSILQTEFGITPMSAFMGALRSRDEVRIKVKLDLREALRECGV